MTLDLTILPKTAGSGACFSITCNQSYFSLGPKMISRERGHDHRLASVASNIAAL